MLSGKRNLPLLVCFVLGLNGVLLGQTDSTKVDSTLESVLSRTSIVHEISGATFFPTLNVEYDFVQRPIWTLGARIGGGFFVHRSTDPMFWSVLGLTSKIGRKSSKLHISAGASVRFRHGEEQLDWNVWRERGVYGVGYHAYFGLGYRYIHKHGFMVGLDAYVLFPLNEGYWNTNMIIITEETPYPWLGLTFGYKFPNKQTHQKWRKRALEYENRQPDVDSLMLEEELMWLDDEDDTLSAKEIRRLKRQAFNEMHAALPRGRSIFYIEFLGMAKHYSVNYEINRSFLKNDLLTAYGRIGIGGYDYSLTRANKRNNPANEPIESAKFVHIPIEIGLRVGKDLKGGGVGFGVVPTYSSLRGMVMAFYINPNFQFHLGHGVTAGLNVSAVFGGDKIYEFNRSIIGWGGVYLGYRIPRLRKEAIPNWKRE